MDNLFQAMALAALAVFVLDLIVATNASFKGRERPRTVLGVLLGRKASTSGLMPVGKASTFSNADSTICMDKKDNRTRLTYFSDDNNHFWFKSEKILANGTAVGEPRFEPATMTLQQKAVKFI